MSKTSLVVEDLKVWFSEKLVIKGISTVIEPGTVTAIMGPSGSGKSTFLKSINRLLELNPNARVRGRILLDGIDIYKIDPYRVRRYIGMVFQHPNPLPHMSIYDNVALGPRLHRLVATREELDRVVRWALEKALLWEEVRDRLNEPPTILSGGQQQRLCLARALAVKPKVLLLDEPTSNIDPVNAKKLERVIASLAKEYGITILIVTHTPKQAARISDYILFIYNGYLVEAGPTRSILSHPRTKLLSQFFSGELG